MRKRVKIIEAIPQGQGQEQPILGELLQMAGLPVEIKDVTKEDDEWEAFLDSIQCEERWLHISSHGDGQSLSIGESEDDLSANDLLECFENESPLKGKLISLSVCGTVANTFAETLATLGANAVIAPMAPISFVETATFSAMFYFSLAKIIDDADLRDEPFRNSTASRLAQYIDCFGRVTTAYRSIGGGGAYRLDYWWNDKHAYIH